VTWASRPCHNLAQILQLGESCSCSSSCSCSCSIRGTSAPKREPDPLAIILFHHFDREICRILEDEHEHDSPEFGILVNRSTTNADPEMVPGFIELHALGEEFLGWPAGNLLFKFD